MEEIAIILCCVLIYILSLLYVRYWIKVSHSPNGVYEDSKIDRDDFMLTVIPIINTLMASNLLFQDKRKIKRDYNKFFGLKK